MHVAVEVPDAEFLRMALEHGGDPNLRAGPLDAAVIFTAMWSDYLDKVQLLIDAGADINGRGNYDLTPVLTATMLKQVDVTYMLLDQGADFSARNEFGQNIVDYIRINRPLMNEESDEWQWMLKVSDWLRGQGVSVPE